MESLLTAFLIIDIAERTGASIEEVEADFDNFNAEVDRVIAEEGLDEDEAIEKVLGTWKFGFKI